MLITQIDIDTRGKQNCVKSPASPAPQIPAGELTADASSRRDLHCAQLMLHSGVSSAERDAVRGRLSLTTFLS